MVKGSYWDSEQVNVCICGATTIRWQPVFYVGDRSGPLNGYDAIKLDSKFDTEEACDQFIADYLETKFDSTDLELLQRIAALVEDARPAPKLDEMLQKGQTWSEQVERKMPETLEERLDALTTLVKLYMDKTDKHLKWHDGRAGGGFVYDHIHYDTDMGSGGVVR